LLFFPDAAYAGVEISGQLGLHANFISIFRLILCNTNSRIALIHTHHTHVHVITAMDTDSIFHMDRVQIAVFQHWCSRIVANIPTEVHISSVKTGKDGLPACIVIGMLLAS
jgi:hypothetical protein